MDELVDALIKV